MKPRPVTLTGRTHVITEPMEPGGKPHVWAAEIVYDTDDPHAVRITMHLLGRPSTLVVSRQMLADALAADRGAPPVGDGTVKWRRHLTDDRWLVLTLTGGGEPQHVKWHANDLTDFIVGTWRRVPPGRETDPDDLDAALARLLGGA